MEWRQLTSLAWPIVGTQLLHLTMQVIDSVLVGHLGVSSLAAIGMASAYYSILICASFGMLSAMSPFISRAVGAGDRVRAGHLFRQGVWLALALSVLFVAGNLTAPYVFTVMGQPPELIPIAGEYLRTISWGVPASLLFLTCRQFTEATGNTRPSVVSAAVGAIFHAFLAYGLVYGKFGMPALGTKGSAIGTAVASWTMASMLGLYLWKGRAMRNFAPWRGSFRPDVKILKELTWLGAPMAGAWLCEVSFFSAATIAAGLLGTRSLAAHQIALNAASFVFMVPLGISYAVGIRVGHSAGRHDPYGLQRAAKAGLGLTITYELMSATAFLFGAPVIASLYTADAELIPPAILLLRIAGGFQLFDGIQVVSMGILRALKDTRVPFFNTVIAFWALGAPLAFVLTFPLKMGTAGLWFAMMLGLASASLLHWRRFRRVTAVRSMA